MGDFIKDYVSEKIRVMGKKPLVLPVGVNYQRISLPSGKEAYVFYDDQLGELGRLIVLPQQDQSQWICEVFGEPHDPLTQKRRELFIPLARMLIKQKRV